jgi:hypothetical protein
MADEEQRGLVMRILLRVMFVLYAARPFDAAKKWTEMMWKEH